MSDNRAGTLRPDSLSDWVEEMERAKGGNERQGVGFAVQGGGKFDVTALPAQPTGPLCNNERPSSSDRNPARTADNNIITVIDGKFLMRPYCTPNIRCPLPSYRSEDVRGEDGRRE